MRVLLVSVASRPGGAERSLELLIESLAGMGISCCLAGASGVDPGRVKESLCSFRRLCSFEPSRRPGLKGAVALLFRWVHCVLTVLRTVVVEKPDVIHANTTAAALVSVLPARLCRKPLIWHVRDTSSLGWLGRLLSRQSAQVIAVSRYVADCLVGQGVPRDKIVVIPNGVSPTWLSQTPSDTQRQKFRTQHGLDKDNFVFLNVGQYVSWKRQDLLLQAAAQVVRSCPEARFVVVGSKPIAGDPGCRRQLEELTATLGLERRALLLHWHDEIESVYLGCDALVHTASSEPFGRALIEAMSAGLPAIAVRSGGPAEIIEREPYGLLVEPDNLPSLVHAMIRVCGDRAFGCSVGRAGRQRVRQRFTAEKTAAAVGDVYETVVNGSGVPGLDVRVR